MAPSAFRNLVQFKQAHLRETYTQMSRRTTQPTKWPGRPAKTQISLRIRLVWSEFWLSAWRNIGPLTTYWVHSED